MMRAWAVIKNGAPLERIELPLPEPRGRQVLLEVTHCGVCHSDVHLWDGHYGLGGDKKMLLKDRGVTLPIVMGHEIVGRVVALGPDAHGPKVGDVRVVYPWVGCGTCDLCQRNEDNMCLTPRSIGVFQHGGYASHVLAMRPEHLIDPGTLDPWIAGTYACSGLTAYGAVKKVLPMRPDDPIVVVGAGGLGLSAIAILRALGHRSIVSLDVQEEKRQAAARAGASLTLDSSGTDVAKLIVDSCGGMVGAIIDFVNSGATAKMGFDALRRGGKLVLVGFFGGELALPLPLMPLRALTIAGSYVGSPQDLHELIALGQHGALPPIPVARTAYSQINDVLLRLKQGDVTGRIVLEADEASTMVEAGARTLP